MSEQNDGLDTGKYRALLAEHLPRVIGTKQEYENTAMILEAFLSRGRTPEEERFAEMPQLLTGDYLKKQATLTRQALTASRTVRQAIENLSRLSFLEILPKQYSRQG